MGGEAGEPATGGEGGDGEDGPYCVMPGDACDESLDGRRQCCREKESDVVECVDGICVLIPQPFVCEDTWTRHELGTDLTGEGVCLAENDCYVAHAKIGGPGYVSRFDGSDWSNEELNFSYPLQRIETMCQNGQGRIWAGGARSTGGAAPYAALYYKDSGGVWTEESVDVFTLDDEIVRSVRANGNIVLMAVDVMPSTQYWDTEIFMKSGGVWSKMTTPSHPVPTSITSVSGRSSGELYAVGGTQQVDGGNVVGWIGAILWYYDGSSWSDLSSVLPNDVAVLHDVAVNDDGEIYVVGISYEYEGADQQGVRLVSDDLMNWTRSDCEQDANPRMVYSPRIGAALVGGGAIGSLGSARLSESSMGVWTEYAIDGIAGVVNAIWPVPNTDLFMFSASGGTGKSAVYTGTCQ
jgi:hypothetical protein